MNQDKNFPKADSIQFAKSDNGLIPAIIQDNQTLKVLMQGWMNAEAYEKTVATGKVTFFSRSKNRLWTKGEESGHYLDLVSVDSDCDADALLIKVKPAGPVCHTGADTCWNEQNTGQSDFLTELEGIITQRRTSAEVSKSYVAQLFEKGIPKIAQKVGEEAVETVIEAMSDNDHLFLEESADLLFHYLILLQSKGFKLEDILEVLKRRHQKSQ